MATVQPRASRAADKMAADIQTLMDALGIERIAAAIAKALGLVEYDGAGNAVNIKPLKNNYFKKWGLPEADIVKLVTDLLRFNFYIKKHDYYFQYFENNY